MCASLAALVFAGLTVASRVSPLRAARFILRSVDTVDEMWFLRGKSVRWRILDLLYATGILRPVQVLVAPGFAMNVDRIDYVTRDILMTGIWEPHITGITMAALKEGDVFFDIGAHVGYYTLLASTLVGTSGKVIALEPNPPTADRLRANIQLNKFTNISVYQAAAADNEGSLPFFQAGNEHNAWSSLSKVNALGGREIVVKSLRLDSIANSESLTRVDLMKLDVEGAEMQVLRGARQILTTFRPRIITELKPGALGRLGAGMDEVVAYLHANGYTLGRKIDHENYFWLPDPEFTPGKTAARFQPRPLSGGF